MCIVDTGPMAASPAHTATAGWPEHQAFIIDRPGAGHYQNLSTPEPHLDQILCKTIAVGLCGTDRRIWRGTMPMVTYPRIPGHEVVARVIIDPRHRLQDMCVTVNPYNTCRACTACLNGHPNRCSRNETFGVQRDGLLRTHFMVPRERILAVGVTDTDAARKFYLTEPLAVALHAAELGGKIEHNEWVLITGYGNLGHLLAKIMTWRGARVILVSHQIDASEVARLRATSISGTVDGHTLGLIKEATGGEGVTLAFEAAGAPATLNLCLDSAAPGGRVVLIGHTREFVDLRGTDVVLREAKIIGSRNALHADFQRAIGFIEQDPLWYTLPEEHFPATEILAAFNSTSGKKIVIDYE